MQVRGCVIAGLSGGSGKSVVAVGLAAALRQQGYTVVPFKKGPDYIDAGWLKVASRHDCYNLDPYLVDQEKLRESFARHAAQGDIALLEGNRGIYDGVTADGGYSTADLAVLLDLPVILVVNCSKTTRTVAALVMGCQHFDPKVPIVGVILNNVATERQRRLISESITKYTGLPVFGSIPRLHQDVFPMRHLGMIPYQEYDDYASALALLVETVQNNCNIPAIIDVMRTLLDVEIGMTVPAIPKKSVRIGILQDAAFQFYYSENLEALEQEGAELVPINALRDTCLPDIDGLYIGGGFPETNARELSGNTWFLNSVKQAARDGLPVYAECGGLIYLGQSITMDRQEYPLVDLLPVRFGMSNKPQAHGYSGFVVERENPFYPVGSEIRGHEFRYSTVAEWTGNDEMLTVKMIRGRGFANGYDGVSIHNVFALYTHIHADGTPAWAPQFVAACKKRKDLAR